MLWTVNWIMHVQLVLFNTTQKIMQMLTMFSVENPNQIKTDFPWISAGVKAAEKKKVVNRPDGKAREAEFSLSVARFQEKWHPSPCRPPRPPRLWTWTQKSSETGR